MGIRRFISKGVTVKRVMNLLRVEVLYHRMILYPLYELMMKLQHSKQKLLLSIVDRLSNILEVEPKKFVTYIDYVNNYPAYIQVIKNENVCLSYSDPIFDDVESAANPIIDHQTHVQYIACFRDAKIIGNSSIILLEKNNLLYEIKSLDTRSAVLYLADSGIVYDKNNDLIVSRYENSINYEKGIWMGGNFSWNFYHLLYEFLIKFQYVESASIPSDVPIIIDKICIEVPQFKNILDILNTQQREIISIDKGLRCKINQLYYISCPNYIPPHFRNDKDIKSTDMLFQIKPMLNLRNILLSQVSDKKFPKRFYISRKKASGRRPFNEDAVFDLLKTYGFASIAPEEFTVTEQMALFNGAEFIVGGSGAAFTNLLYCSENCKAIIFTKNRLPFSAFSTLASIVGVDLRYITEEATLGDKLVRIHDGFEIDIPLLKNTMDIYQL